MVYFKTQCQLYMILLCNILHLINSTLSLKNIKTGLLNIRVISHIVYSRIYIAAMHFNENANRQQATTKDGVQRWKVSYPKAKRGEECVVKPQKVAATYGKQYFFMISMDINIYQRHLYMHKAMFHVCLNFFSNERSKSNSNS